MRSGAPTETVSCCPLEFLRVVVKPNSRRFFPHACCDEMIDGMRPLPFAPPCHPSTFVDGAGAVAQPAPTPGDPPAPGGPLGFALCDGFVAAQAAMTRATAVGDSARETRARAVRNTPEGYRQTGFAARPRRIPGPVWVA